MDYLVIGLISAICLNAVADAVQFTVNPLHTAVRLGDSAVIPCAVDTAERVVEWTYKDAKIYDSTSNTVTDPSQYEVTHAEDTNYDLRIKNVQPENTGLYTCRMPEEDLEDNAYLIGLGGVDCSDGVEVPEGERFYLECNATFYSDGLGTMRPNLVWYRGEESRSAYSHFSYTESDIRYSIGEIGRAEDNDYDFTCRLMFKRSTSQLSETPIYPKDISCTTPVTVAYAPRNINIVPTPQYAEGLWTVTAKVGEQVKCTVKGGPTPVVTWIDGQQKEISSTSQLLVTKEMKNGKEATCYARNTVNGEKKELFQQIRVFAEGGGAGSGSKHTYGFATTVILAAVALSFAW